MSNFSCKFCPSVLVYSMTEVLCNQVHHCFFVREDLIGVLLLVEDKAFVLFLISINALLKKKQTIYVHDDEHKGS